MTSDTKKVLIVEDEIDLRFILRSTLEAQGMVVEEAHSGNAARKLIELNPLQYVTVITDINMEDGSGLELVEWMRSRPMRVPVIFISAFDSKDHMRQGLRLGAFDFISKPFSLTEVAETTSRCREAGKKILALEAKLNSPDTDRATANEILKQLDQSTLLQALNQKKKKAPKAA